MILASDLAYVASGTLRNKERRRYQNLSPRRTILSAGTSARPEECMIKTAQDSSAPPRRGPFPSMGSTTLNDRRGRANE